MRETLRGRHAGHAGNLGPEVGQERQRLQEILMQNHRELLELSTTTTPDDKKDGAFQRSKIWKITDPTIVIYLTCPRRHEHDDLITRKTCGKPWYNLSWLVASRMWMLNYSHGMIPNDHIIFLRVVESGEKNRQPARSYRPKSRDCGRYHLVIKGAENSLFMDDFPIKNH